MKKNKLFIYVLLLLLIIFLFLFTAKEEERIIEIRGERFFVEIANNDKKRTRGLGGREDLCDNCGMLFEFPQKGKYGFWMNDMNFPLDLIWILDNKIVHIEKNISQDDERTFLPSIEVGKVLEINAGKSDNFNLQIGDEIFSK